MLVSNIAPTGAPSSAAALAPSMPSLALPTQVDPMCCGRCGCGGKVLALAGAANSDPLAALRGISELG